MVIRFDGYKQFFLWLSRNYKFKARSFPRNYIDFNKMEFESPEKFLDFLKSNSIIQVINKPVEILHDTKWAKDIFKEYDYDVESIILEKNQLDALFTDLYLDSKIKDKLLTIKEVGFILGVTRPSVYKLFDTGKLEYYEILSQKKVKLSHLNEFIKNSKNKS
jgi:hypothetical protein